MRYEAKMFLFCIELETIRAVRVVTLISYHVHAVIISGSNYSFHKATHTSVLRINRR